MKFRLLMSETGEVTFQTDDHKPSIPVHPASLTLVPYLLTPSHPGYSGLRPSD